MNINKRKLTCKTNSVRLKRSLKRRKTSWLKRKLNLREKQHYKNSRLFSQNRKPKTYKPNSKRQFLVTKTELRWTEKKSKGSFEKRRQDFPKKKSNLKPSTKQKDKPTKSWKIDSSKTVQTLSVKKLFSCLSTKISKMNVKTWWEIMRFQFPNYAMKMNNSWKSEKVTKLQ